MKCDHISFIRNFQSMEMHLQCRLIMWTSIPHDASAERSIVKAFALPLIDAQHDEEKWVESLSPYQNPPLSAC